MTRSADSGEPYVAVVGEALWDLLEDTADGCYRPVPGGSCLNVAVGVARLGHRVEFVGAFAGDVLGGRLRAFLAGEGVGDAASPTVAGQSTLAVTTFDGPEPFFSFYGHPAAYAGLVPGPPIAAATAGAAVVHAGSIALLADGVRQVALEAFAGATGWTTLDPNVRPDLVPDLDAYRRQLEELAGATDLVKLSAEDAHALYGPAAPEAPDRLLAAGASAVLVTLGPGGALLRTPGHEVRHGTRAATVVDATGAGDAVMAAVVHGLVRGGWPADAQEWDGLVGFAMDVAGVVCGRPGGATAMPTLAEVDGREAQRA